MPASAMFWQLTAYKNGNFRGLADFAGSWMENLSH